MSTQITIPHGGATVTFSVPDNNLLNIISPKHVPPVADPHSEIEKALNNPLGAPRIEDSVKSSDHVTILVDDYTRTTPAELGLQHLVSRLHRCGIPDQHITLLISPGTHRPCTQEELLRKLGAENCGKFNIEQHDCMDKAKQVFLGTTSSGTPVWVNKLVVETDRLYGIGHIDPSDYAGYSGGNKLIVPGVAGLETIDANHSLATQSFRAYGNVDSPCRKDIDRAGAMVRVDLVINFILCQDGRVACALAGSPSEVHRAGVPVAREVYERSYSHPVDLCITSGYPYDVDFYQAIRALAYADTVVRPGGAILLIAPCPDGFGSPELFALLTSKSKSPDDFLERIARREGKVTYNLLGFYLTRIQEEKRVYGYLPGVTPSDLAAIGICPIENLQNGVDDLMASYGLQDQTIIFPVGSATIPRLVNPPA